MSRWSTLADAIVAALTDAISDGDFPKPPTVEVSYAVNEQLELQAGTSRVLVEPIGPHSSSPSGVAPVSEHSISLWLIFAKKLDGEPENHVGQVPELLDALQTMLAAVEGISASQARFSGFTAEAAYDRDRLLKDGLFWSETQVTFAVAYSA